MTDSETTKFSTTLRRTTVPNIVVVPPEVVQDARLSLADLGLYVKLAARFCGEADVDELVAGLLAGDFGERVDVDEAGLRAGVQRLIDAGVLEVDTAKAKAAREKRDFGPY